MGGANESDAGDDAPDITLTHVQFHSRARIKAGGLVTLEAAFDSEAGFAEHRESHFGTFVATSDGRVHGGGHSTQRSKDNSSDYDTHAVGSTLPAGGDVAIEAGGDVALGGALEDYRHDTLESTRVTLGKEDDGEASTRSGTRLVRGEVEAGGQLIVKAGGQFRPGAVDIVTGHGSRTDTDEGVVYELELSTDYSQHTGAGRALRPCRQRAGAVLRGAVSVTPGAALRAP